MKPLVVLYNPRADFYTMPLALLAIGSAIDRSRYEVVIVDGRVERHPIRAIKRLVVDRAVWLGVTVLTGSPITDAMKVSRAAKAVRPDLPVVWGGWHPSLFGSECLREESSIDVTVQGQGEQTFPRLLETYPDLKSAAGCCSRAVEGIVSGPPRPLADINQFPAHDYGLIDVGRYFRLKANRQLDYVSSQGCRFRCSFCADPFVYDREWSGLEPERVGEEIEYWWKKYRFEDVNFQDETFFTRASRVAQIAEQFLRRNLHISWAGTLRADQAARLGEDMLPLLKRSGLRRVMVGVESGHPVTLKLLAKDITLEQVYTTADLCLRHRIGAIFPFIVGLPGETGESITETLRMAYRLRRMSPDFRVEVFFYLPYPGAALAVEAERNGFPLPQTLKDWGRFDYVNSCGPWVDGPTRRRVGRFKIWQRFAGCRPTMLRRPIQSFAQWQCRRLILE